MSKKNYTQAIYTVDIEFSEPPAEVFNQIIDLSKWWPEEYVGESIRLDTEFVFKTGEGHYSKNRVIEFIPDKKLAWMTTESLRKSDDFDWSGTKFILELTPKDEKTLVHFIYDGVVLENERDILIKVCDMTIKDRLFHYISEGKSI